MLSCSKRDYRDNVLKRRYFELKIKSVGAHSRLIGCSYNIYHSLHQVVYYSLWDVFTLAKNDQRELSIFV